MLLFLATLDFNYFDEIYKGNNNLNHFKSTIYLDMRVLIILFIASFIFSFSAYSQTYVKSILILGDSNLKGHFGEYLQKKIHETGKYDVLSIAIGGAGSKTFLPPMKNQCCGYRVRQSCAGVALVKSKKAKETKIPVLERAEKPTKGIVMKWYNGNLNSVMSDWKPDAVILVLGTNCLNAHDELLKIIRTYKQNIPIIWVGPFDKSNSAGRYDLIEKALKGKSDYLLVKSDSIVNKLGIVPTHFSGDIAKKLAEAIYKQFELFLNVSISSKEWYR
jgi:hypothetical protein